MPPIEPFDLALDSLLGCLAELDAVARTVSPAQLVDAIRDHALNNPEILEELAQSLPSVRTLFAALEQELFR